MYSTQILIEGVADALRIHAADGDLINAVADAMAEAKPRFDRERFVAQASDHEALDALNAEREEQTSYLVVEASGNGADEARRVLQQHATVRNVSTIDEDAAFVALGSA